MSTAVASSAVHVTDTKVTASALVLRMALKFLLYLVFAVFVILTVFPLIWLAYTSFKPFKEISMHPLALPQVWIISNYINAWEKGHLGQYIVNSIIYTSVTTIATIVLGLMASFGFAKIPYKINGFLHGLFIIGILLTLQSILIPLFLMETMVKLNATRLGILIPYIGISLPFAIYLGTEYIKGIPDALIESAKMDGAGYLRIFFSIILPMTTPVAVTIAIMTVLGIWNEFMLVFVLSADADMRSLPVGIFSFSGPLATESGWQAAALMIGLIPMLVFYILFHKRITEGVTAGAVKG